MISVEQVRALEERVEKAVGFITALKTENAGLRRDLELAKSESSRALNRVAELESAAEAFRRDQVSIEEGIMHALRKLDAFEDLVLKVGQHQGRPEGASGTSAAAGPRAAIEARPPAVPPVLPASFPVSEPPVHAAAPTAPRTEVQPEEPTAAKTADELSLEELEAATAPVPAEDPPAPAPSTEGELDIF